MEEIEAAEAKMNAAEDAPLNYMNFGVGQLENAPCEQPQNPIHNGR
jgi:hypothetical protein